MVQVPVPGNRATMTDGPDGLQFVIPPRRQLFPMIFLPIWLAGWLFGEAAAIRELASGRLPRWPFLFMVIWLVAWTVGGAFVLLCVAWMYVGRERVVLRPDMLVIRREVLGLARAREYDLGRISNLRVSLDAPSLAGGWVAQKYLPLGGGIIAFDYGAKTLRFGGSIDEPEARGILAELRRRHRFANPADAD